MSTAARRLTPDDLLQLPDDGKGFELVGGEFQERTVSKESVRVGLRIGVYLTSHCDAHGGWAYGADLGYCCFPDDSDRVRKADASYISFARMPVETYADGGYCTTCPDLVAEVVSPGDKVYKVEAKLGQWLAAGVRVVWILHPETRTIRVHRAEGSYAFLRDTDTLTAPDLLPGFAVPVADLFRLPGEPVRPSSPSVS